MASLLEYDGWLQASTTKDQLDTITMLGERHGVSISGSTREFEVEYSGRDTNRRVAKLLVEIAAIVGTADGEIRCEVHDDEHLDPRFEFFTIQNGQLLVSEGRIVRGPKRRYRL